MSQDSKTYQLVVSRADGAEYETDGLRRNSCIAISVSRTPPAAISTPT